MLTMRFGKFKFVNRTPKKARSVTVQANATPVLNPTDVAGLQPQTPPYPIDAYQVIEAVFDPPLPELTPQLLRVEFVVRALDQGGQPHDYQFTWEAPVEPGLEFFQEVIFAFDEINIQEGLTPQEMTNQKPQAWISSELWYWFFDTSDGSEYTAYNDPGELIIGQHP